MFREFGEVFSGVRKDLRCVGSYDKEQKEVFGKKILDCFFFKGFKV